MVKIKLGSFVFEVVVLFFFSRFIFVSLFLLFVYIIICLFSLGLHSFFALKHVRLLDLIVLVFALFCSCYFWVRVWVCMHMHKTGLRT